MCMHISVASKNVKQITWELLSCLLSEPTFWPPQFFFFFCFLKNFAACENKYSGLDMPKNKFSGQVHAENT